MSPLFDKKQEKQDRPIISLTKEELIFLLFLIKDSQFNGTDVQVVYNTAVKLQEMVNRLGE